MLSSEARRAAVYIGGGALLVAWLSAANSPHRLDDVRSDPATTQAPPKEDLASAISAQASRLRERLAQAPAPASGRRNPFSFAPPPVRATAPAARTTAAAEPSITQPIPVPLTLMGVAEEPSPEGAHRTAIIGGPGEAIYMVIEGQAFADRYRVKTIGVDAIELEDLLTGGYRRLALK